MLQGINDSIEQAKQLVTLVKACPAIQSHSFNPFPDSGFERSSPGRIGAFRDVLMQSGLVTTTRKTRGDDIDGACGQLAGQVQDRTQRKMRRNAVTQA
jgi:23S rRNA (adenine2503-C2)-methyltransferase